jgi:hypothetical protein
LKALNPMGQVPCFALPTGEILTQSVSIFLSSSYDQHALCARYDSMYKNYAFFIHESKVSIILTSWQISIMEYLEDAYPEKRLLPDCPLKRAKVPAAANDITTRRRTLFSEFMTVQSCSTGQRDLWAHWFRNSAASEWKPNQHVSGGREIPLVQESYWEGIHRWVDSKDTGLSGYNFVINVYIFYIYFLYLSSVQGKQK